MRSHIISMVSACGLILGISGCAEVKSVLKPGPRPATTAPATGATPPPPPEGARTAEAFDTTTAEQRADAVAAAGQGGAQALGSTVASLGSPTEPGFWIKTPLVASERSGRVETVTGEAVAVTLIPSGGPAGGGSQLSLAAFRALGLSLTSLPQVKVFAN